MTDNENMGEKARSSVFWSVSLKAVQQIYQLVVLGVVARILDPKMFGSMAITMSIVLYLNNLTGFGFTNAIVQRETVDKNDVNCIFTFNLLLSILFVPLCYLSAPFLAEQLNNKDIAKLLPQLAIFIPIATFYNIPMALLRREMHYKLHSIIDLVQYITYSTFLLLLTLMNYEVWALVYSTISGYVVSVILLLTLTPWKPRLLFDIRRLRSFWDYGSWDIIRYHINYLDENAANFIISRYIGSQMLGFYERAGAVASMPMRKIQMQVSSVIFSVFSRLQNDNIRLFHAFSKSFNGIALYTVPLLLGLLIVSPYFVRILFGDKWTPMVPTLQILCLASLFKILSDVMTSINIAVNHYRKQTLVNSFSLFIFLCFAYFFIEKGIYGISVASLIASILNFFFNCHITSRYFDVTYKLMVVNLAPSFLAGISMVLVYYIVTPFVVNMNVLLQLSTVGTSCISAYVCFIAMVPKYRQNALAAFGFKN